MLGDPAPGRYYSRMASTSRCRFAIRLLTPLLLTVLLYACAGQTPAGLPDILFVRQDDDGHTRLYRQSGPAAPPQLLSGPAVGDVIDFAPSPDGRQIVYSVLVGADGELRRVDPEGRSDRLLLACPGAECSAPVWSPDGLRLVFERRVLDEFGAPGSPRLLWLDPATGETLPLVAAEVVGYGVRFSPDGAWISYVSPADEGVVLYRLEDGVQRLISSRVGRPATFSPDSSQIIVSDIVLVEQTATAPDEAVPAPARESSRVFLYRVDLSITGRERISPDLAIDDGAPSWSPDGQWLAFSRAPADTAAGRQLWLMRPDGSEARALTDAPDLFHGPPAWSPDGKTLLYQRYDLGSSTARPGVWTLRLSDGQQTLVAPGGYLPAWLPDDRGQARSR